MKILTEPWSESKNVKKNTCIFDEGAKYEENAGNHPLANTGHACEQKCEQLPNFPYIFFATYFTNFPKNCEDI
jgi:hypothetical protein